MHDKSCIHKLVADVTLIAAKKVLLVRYRDTSGYDGEEGWFLPDDYLRRSEHPEEASRRILRDQAGIDVPALVLSQVESFEGHGHWHLIFHYSASLPTTPTVSAGSNVKEIAWFPLEGLPPTSEMAHDGWGLETIRAVLAKPA